MNAFNYRTAWTLPDEQELIRRHRAGETDQEIACAMGRTRVAIINKRDKLGIHHGQICSRQRERANEFTLSNFKYENFGWDDVERFKNWKMCPDHEFPNVNFVKITGLPKPGEPQHGDESIDAKDK